MVRHQRQPELRDRPRRHRARATAATAFETFAILDWLLLAACLAPFILAWIVARGHKLTWKPGEVTMIVGITAFVLILCNGIILGRPGARRRDLAQDRLPRRAARLRSGMAFSGFLRQSRYTEGRKPPGVI